MNKHLLVLFILILTQQTSQSQVKNFIDQPYIEVHGHADTLITPDEIFIRIIISERDSRDRQSVEEQESKMINALIGLGIDIDKNLTVNDIGSNFKFYILKSKDVIKTKIYMLKVTDAVIAGKVFEELENLGISNTSIDKVSYSAIDALRNIMRIKAVEDSRAKASALVKPLGQNIGSAIFITDNDQPDITGQLSGKTAGLAIRGFSKELKEDKAKIDFEKIEVSANVNVNFILK